jgi:outer membrane protein OmpA-like peptidoglycan-associated protein
MRSPAWAVAAVAAAILTVPGGAAWGETEPDELVVGAWASDPRTATGVSGGVRDVSGEVRDLVLGVETIDGSFGVARGGEKTTVTVSADVLFAFDRADLTPAASAKLADVAREMRAGGASGTVLVGGHADAKGSAQYNQALSERRARAVVAALTPLVRDLSLTMQSQGYGATQPVAPNTQSDGADNPAGRAKNRRVTVTFTT